MDKVVFKLKTIGSKAQSRTIESDDYSFEEIAKYLNAEDPIGSITNLHNRLNEISNTGYFRKTITDENGNILRDSDGNILWGDEENDFITPDDDEPDLIKRFAAAHADPEACSEKEFYHLQALSQIIETLSDNEHKDILQNLMQKRNNNDDDLDQVFRNFIKENIEDMFEDPASSSSLGASEEDTNVYLGNIKFGQVKASKREEISNDGHRHYHFLDNINDSGLNLCVVEDTSYNGKIGIIIKDDKGKDAESLNENQWYALIQYFHSSNTLPDNWKELNKIQVTHSVTNPRKTDEDGWCEKEKITENLGDALANEFKLYTPEEQEAINHKAIEEAQAEQADLPSQPESNDNDNITQDRGASISPEVLEKTENVYNDIKELEPDENFGQYKESSSRIPVKSYSNLKDGIKAAKDKFTEKYGPLDQGDPSHAVTSLTFDWAGNATLCIWPNKGAKNKDNKIHTKDWSQDGSTKCIAVKFYKGLPIRASLFVPNLKNFDAKDAGAVLAAFKARGATTFTMPPASVYGAQVFDSFLEASVKAGLPLKISAMDIQLSDLKKIHEFIDGDKSKLQAASAQRIQFLIRYSEELKKKMETMKPSERSTAGTWLLGYQKRIRFEVFNSSTLLTLKGFVGGNVDEIVPKEIIKDGDCVNDLHGIAAKIGLGKILAAIDKGRVLNIVVDNNGNPVIENGKPKLKEPKYKPLDPRTSDTRYMTAVLKAYVALEYENVEKAAKDQVEAEKRYRNKDKGVTSGDDRIYPSAIRALKDRYDSKYNALIDDICDGGGSFLQAKDLKVDIEKGLQKSQTILNIINPRTTTPRPTSERRL